MDRRHRLRAVFKAALAMMASASTQNYVEVQTWLLKVDLQALFLLDPDQRLYIIYLCSNDYRHIDTIRKAEIPARLAYIDLEALEQIVMNEASSPEVPSSSVKGTCLDDSTSYSTFPLDKAVACIQDAIMKRPNARILILSLPWIKLSKFIKEIEAKLKEASGTRHIENS
ncbi:Hypothetical predicted protein [Olea europaea subsp. europaea]|uniref:Uncharacterized protein n=1 Tax=Olea europaea subsp. europaea TaxID=158383 RepID=A0A8S0RBS6_OLEEU|nr:Hypothetical predicted protein [Olea europaea subsp. europaea]